MTQITQIIDYLYPHGYNLSALSASSVNEEFKVFT